MTRKKWLRKSKLSKQKNEWTRQAEKLLTNWFFLFSNRNLEDSYATRYGYLRWIWMTDNACWWHVFGNVMGKQLRIRLNHIIFSLATYWAMACTYDVCRKKSDEKKRKASAQTTHISWILFLVLWTSWKEIMFMTIFCAYFSRFFHQQKKLFKIYDYCTYTNINK